MIRARGCRALEVSLVIDEPRGGRNIAARGGCGTGYSNTAQRLGQGCWLHSLAEKPTTRLGGTQAAGGGMAPPFLLRVGGADVRGHGGQRAWGQAGNGFGGVRHFDRFS